MRRGGHEECLGVEKGQLKSYDTLHWRVSTDLGDTTIRLPTYALIDRSMINNERSEKKNIFTTIGMFLSFERTRICENYFNCVVAVLDAISQSYLVTSTRGCRC